MNKIKKYGFYALGSAISLLGFSKFALAAPDPDFASSTGVIMTAITDNKSQVLLYIAGIVGITLILSLIIKVLFFGKNAILGSIPGRKTKRKG